VVLRTPSPPIANFFESYVSIRQHVVIRFGKWREIIAQDLPPEYLRSGITGSARIGTPTDIADAMQEWFENGTCDGFNITPTHLAGGCEDFVELVVPELQRRGLFRIEYEDKTLRENLGLKRPVSRYAAAGLDRNLDTAK
jgi:alkanesulfonate monooxygenase SsuD/methylene tetrahydromethanopterin reductase-like flavin-dependent oxidoreductase (luciferase family)